ncbi:MAG: hypothetical protein ACQ9MH_08240 [Nitrospinales bacterium]
MGLENISSIILALIPLVLGIVLMASKASLSILKPIGLVTVTLLGLVLQPSISLDPSSKLLVFAVLLSGFCVILSQQKTEQASENCSSILIVLGLSLGVLLNTGLENRVFLIGLFGFIALSFIREKYHTFRTKVILLHISIAIILSLSSIFSGEHILASLFLALTFLPLAPFHFPFVGIIKGAKGNLASFWIVVWLSIGLAELQMMYSSLTAEMLFNLSLLALISAIYASLASLGQQQSHLFIASAIVAHLSLIWGLLDVFPSFPKWGFPFGVGLALIMGAISLAFSFVRQRYGWQIIGKLPGLASSMPRFGIVMVLLVSIAIVLPWLPTVSGLMTMPTVIEHNVEISLVLSIFLVVWLIGSWYFIQMLHQTAFGVTRSEVPYSDLKLAEFNAVMILLIGAIYCGIIL